MTDPWVEEIIGKSIAQAMYDYAFTDLRHKHRFRGKRPLTRKEIWEETSTRNQNRHTFEEAEEFIFNDFGVYPFLAAIGCEDSWDSVKEYSQKLREAWLKGKIKKQDFLLDKDKTYAIIKGKGGEDNGRSSEQQDGEQEELHYG